MANVRHEEEQTKVTNEGSVQIEYMDRASGEDDPEATHVKTLVVVITRYTQYRFGDFVSLAQ